MKSVLGLSQNIIAALSYFFPLGIVFYILERENKFVRFHALQATIALGFLAVLALVPLIGTFIGVISGVVAVVMMVASLEGKETRLPIVGDIVWEQVNK